ncbi:MAG: ABC transporter ATP-binding protein, partial [Planctomycetota bacterium]|nr:ABC transporter ATP-binding protein [Planctomycetota bacterium]
MSSEDPILKVNHLSTRFKTDRGAVTAVDRVSFDLFPGEVLGIVGESGCGKSVTNRSIMRLLPEYTSELSEESEILFDGHNLAHVPEKVMRTIRGNRIAMIFQEPMTALNPVFTIGWQIEEALKYHTSMNRAQRRERVLELLQLVEIPNPEKRINEYPHQLSGGMRQRIVIAMALACEPEILIADEPTTALDVTIQAQILRLMQDLQKKINTAIILITHDLGVVAQVCDRVIVMYAGQIVEVASVTELFHTPQHPYTRALLDSLPRPDATEKGQRLPAIEGIVPSLFELPEGCRFHQRCRFAQ